MAFSWEDLKKDVSESILDFTGNVGKMTNVGTNTDNIDEAIEELTSESYSPIYNTFNRLSADNDLFEESSNFIPAGNIKPTGTTEYGSWDPRLSRVDCFLAKSKENADGTDMANSPLIIPFSSDSAAGAFYDLTFHVEALVAKEIIKYDKGANSATFESSLSKDQADTIDETSKTEEMAHKGSEHVLLGDKRAIAHIKSKGDNYGLASIVNPYTLTKLCGGLILTSSDNTGAKYVENRLYDIRDVRRFYDKSVLSTDDTLSITNPTTTNIITFSNRDPWGRTPYYFLDFVFCKFWNIIPNNRLITLRKYHAPVYDNLQFALMYDNSGQVPDKVHPFAPIATVVTYFGEETGNTLLALTSFTTGVNWQDIPADVHEVSGDSGSNPRATIDEMFSNGSGFTGATSGIGLLIQKGGNLLTSKMISLGKFAGLFHGGGFNINQDQDVVERYNQANVDPTSNLYNNKIIGPVNRIQSTKARKEGLIFDHKLSLTCQYIARPIGGVNTKAAMLDILANCLEIASVDAMFWGGGYKFMIQPHTYPFKGRNFSNQIMDDLYKGKIFGKDGALAHTVKGIKDLGTDNSGNFSWDKISDTLGDILGETLGALGEMLNSITNVLFGSTGLGDWIGKQGEGLAGEDGKERVEAGKKKMNNLFSNLNSMWRSQVILKSVMPTVNGMKAILTGDPVGNWHVTVGNPLNPIMVIGNLICNDMKFEFSDELGPDDFPMELKVVYTLEHGMARDKGSIQSIFNRGNGKIYELPDYIRASSDYESKVDNYTGPSTNGKNGWYTPKYLGATTLGASGYKTYKLSPPKKLAMNANTDNVFIAKFTPVDADAAISNIKNGKSFFSQYSGSRAVIRGTSMTRKFMN